MTSDLGVDGGDHGYIDLEDWFVSINPLEVWEGHVRGELAVGRRRLVCRHRKIKLT